MSKKSGGKTKKISKEYYIETGIPGLDKLFSRGIPQGSSILIVGGTGSGKTIFCLQTLAYLASQGKKCFYLSFEESAEKLKKQMIKFGWEPEKLIQSGKLEIKRVPPFDIKSGVKSPFDIEKIFVQRKPTQVTSEFKPDIIVLDSITALATAFVENPQSYRLFLEKIFIFLEGLECTMLFTSEIKQIPDLYSSIGVEEFLSDGVIVLYNIQRNNKRENSLEVLKMRGEKHDKKMVPISITDKGIIVHSTKQASQD